MVDITTLRKFVKSPKGRAVTLVSLLSLLPASVGACNFTNKKAKAEEPQTVEDTIDYKVHASAADSLLDLSRDFYDNGDPDKARTTLNESFIEAQRALNLFDSDPRNHYRIGEILHALGETDSSLSYLKEAVDRYEILIPVLESEGYDSDFMDSYKGMHEECLKLYATDLYKSLKNKDFESEDDLLEGIKQFEKLVNLQGQDNPKSADYLFWLGELYSEAGRYEAAIDCHTKAIELEPDDANNWTYLIIDYINNRNPLKAEEVLKKARELHPDNEKNWKHLKEDIQTNFYN